MHFYPEGNCKCVIYNKKSIGCFQPENEFEISFRVSNDFAEFGKVILFLPPVGIFKCSFAFSSKYINRKKVNKNGYNK